MNKNKIIKGIIINFFCFVIPSFMTFIINRYFVKSLGVSYLGLMHLFNQLLAYIGIVEMGLGGASAYALYRPLLEKNYERIDIVVSTIRSLYNKIAGGIFLIGIIFIPFLKFFIKEEINIKKIYVYWILYLISTVISYLFLNYNILFTANQEYNFVRITQASIKFIIQILKLIILLKLKSFYFFILAMILENLIQGFIFRVYYMKNYSYINKTKKRDKAIIKGIKNLFFHKIGGLVVFDTDLILISRFLSLEKVGIYASYQIIINLLTNLISIMTNVLIPNVGRHIAGEKESFHLWKKINDIYFVIATVFAHCFFKLSNDFMKLWIGGENTFSQLTVILISINLFILIYRTPIEIFKNAYGYFEDIYSPVMEIIINLGLSLYLIMKIGLNGVIIGTIVSNILIVIILKPILTFKRCFKKSIKLYIYVYLKYSIILFLGVFLGNNLNIRFMSMEVLNIRDWIIKGVFNSCQVFIILIILMFLLDKTFRKNILKIKELKNG